MILGMKDFGMKEFEEKTISTQRIHEGRILNVRVDTVTLPSGNTSKREIVEHHGAVCVVPVREDGKIVMVRQFRKPAEDLLLELPAGGLEKDEDAETCAARELTEECGLQPKKLTPLFTCYLAPGYSTEIMHGFLGEDLQETTGVPDEDENVSVEIYELDELIAMIEDGRICDAKTICGILAYARKSR